MLYQHNPETSGEATPRNMRIATLGEAIINLDYAFSDKPSIPLPNLPGVSFFGKDLEG